MGVAAMRDVPAVSYTHLDVYKRQVVELRDRAANLAGGAIAPQPGQRLDPLSEAIIALQQLGYKPAEAERMAKKAAGEGDAPEAIIRKALQQALR